VIVNKLNLSLPLRGRAAWEGRPLIFCWRKLQLRTWPQDKV